MTTWGFSFKKGLVIFLWSIVWWIVGGIIAGIICGMAVLGAWGALAEAATVEEAMTTVMGALVLMIAGFLIGGIISIIGVFATIVKIVTEAVQQAK